jgi:xanthine/CO dehydrogenase XdhC/CoxF family maturation factor
MFSSAQGKAARVPTWIIQNVGALHLRRHAPAVIAASIAAAEAIRARAGIKLPQRFPTLS